MTTARDAGGNKRRAPRSTVLKRAQIVAGDAVFDCIVVDISESGARVRTATVVPVPERVVLRFAGGTSTPAIRRWTRGVEIGFEFVAGAALRGAAAQRAWAAYESLRDGRMEEAIRLLRAERFFDDEALRQAAEAAEAARARLEAVLRERAQGGHTALGAV